MANYENLPIYKAAYELVLYTEQITLNFSRNHRYTLGSDLRDLSRKAARLIVRANSLREREAELMELRATLEECKLVARLCLDVKAFHNINSFETAIRKVVEISRQNEGWLKSVRAREQGRDRAPMPEG